MVKIIRSRLFSGILLMVFSIFLIILGGMLSVSIVFLFIGIPVIILGIIILLISILKIFFDTVGDIISLLKKPFNRKLIKKEDTGIIDLEEKEGIYKTKK